MPSAPESLRSRPRRSSSAMCSSLLASAPRRTLSMIAESTGPVAIREMTVERTP